LSTYDSNLSRAGASLGAGPLSVFRSVSLPLIFPGVVSGALLAFAVSFDEVIVALFMTGAEQRTLPVQMFSGIRDQINPTIMAAASLLTLCSISLFVILTIVSQRRKG
jgi:putative spermidine/putrescine transport system permease protein